MYEDVLKRDFMQTVISAADADLLLDYLFGLAQLVEVQLWLRLKAFRLFGPSNSYSRLEACGDR